MKENDIYIYGYIDSQTDREDYDSTSPNDIKEKLKKIKNSDDINVFINSGGGDIYAAISIYNQLKRIKNKINVFVDGIAASAATIIACAGDNIKIYNNSVFMIHSAKIGLLGYFDARELSEYAENLKKNEHNLIEIYKNKLQEGISEEEIQQKIDAETWYFGEEVLKDFHFELIDEKMENIIINNYENLKIPDDIKAKINKKEIKKIKNEDEKIKIYKFLKETYI